MKLKIRHGRRALFMTTLVFLPLVQEPQTLIGDCVDPSGGVVAGATIGGHFRAEAGDLWIWGNTDAAGHFQLALGDAVQLSTDGQFEVLLDFIGPRGRSGAIVRKQGLAVADGATSLGVITLWPVEPLAIAVSDPFMRPVPGAIAIVTERPWLKSHPTGLSGETELAAYGLADAEVMLIAPGFEMMTKRAASGLEIDCQLLPAATMDIQVPAQDVRTGMQVEVRSEGGRILSGAHSDLMDSLRFDLGATGKPRGMEVGMDEGGAMWESALFELPPSGRILISDVNSNVAILLTLLDALGAPCSETRSYEMRRSEWRQAETIPNSKLHSGRCIVLEGGNSVVGADVSIGDPDVRDPRRKWRTETDELGAFDIPPTSLKSVRVSVWKHGHRIGSRVMSVSERMVFIVQK